MSERPSPPSPETPSYLLPYYDAYNFAKRSKERMAYHPEGLEIILGLQNLDGGYIGVPLLNKIMKKQQGTTVLQIDLLFLWGMVGTGKSLIASQLAQEIIEQTEGKKTVRVVEIDEAVLAAEAMFGPRDSWGVDERRMMGTFFQSMITESQENGDFTIAVAPAVGDETTRERGGTALRTLAQNPVRRLFVGAYLDPRVQSDSTEVRRIAPSIPVQEVEEHLQRDWNLTFHGVGEDSLFDRLQDPYTRGQVIKYLYIASARPSHIDLLNSEVDRLGEVALEQNPRVRIPAALQQLSGEAFERVRRATAYLENYSRNDLQLRHKWEGNRILIMNPHRPSLRKRQFIDDRRVNLALGYAV
jgi:hypothetical protein